MKTQLFTVAFILVSSCATVADADTCTNCKVPWMMDVVVVVMVMPLMIIDYIEIDVDVAGPGCIFEG